MFPEELLVEIFKRLPVKSHYRCMSVCKSWHSLITCSYFIHTHLNYQKDLSRGNIVPKTFDLYYYYQQLLDSSLKFYTYCDDGFTITELSEFDCPIDSEKDMVICCDGMICFLCSSGPRKCSTIWNPSQRKSLAIGFPPVCTSESDFVVGDHFVCGFGFDSSRNDYKVVMLIRSQSSRLLVFVYSLCVGTWKAINTASSLPVSHWFSARTRHIEDVVYWSMRSSVLAFNLADEKLSEIPFLECMVDYDYEAYGEEFPFLPITVCLQGKDFLGVTCSYYDETVLWVMDEYGKMDSWRQFLTISYAWFPSVQTVRLNGEVLLEVEDESFLSFDLKTRKAHIVSSHERKKRYYLDFFVESLVPLAPQHDTLAS